MSTDKLLKQIQAWLSTQKYPLGIRAKHRLLKNNKAPSNNERFYLKLLPDQQYLTKREMEVFLLLDKPITNKEIAELLNLSKRTVEYYIENLLRKFHCKNKKELRALRKLMN